jgi:transcriptional regulator with XRE-family HTH domain
MANSGPGDRASESFEALLRRHRDRTGLTQRELGARLAVSEHSVQDWESGLNNPGARNHEALVVALLEAAAWRPDARQPRLKRCGRRHAAVDRDCAFNSTEQRRPGRCERRRRRDREAAERR